MSDPNIKKEFFPFDYTDLTALEEMLARRASEGWMITSLRGMLTYERRTPRQMRFNADILPMADKNTNIINEESRKYIDFCEDTGWHFIGNRGVVYVFCTEDPSLPDVTTDDEEKVRLIKKTCKRNNGLVWFSAVTLLLNLGMLLFDILSLSGKSNAPKCILACLACVCFGVVLIMAILKTVGLKKWIKTADEALAEGRPIPYNSIETLEKRRRWLILFMIFLLLIMLIPLWLAASSGSKSALIGAAFALVIGLSTGLFAVYISRKELSVGKQVLFILLFMIGVGIAAVLLTVIIGTLIGELGWA